MYLSAMKVGVGRLATLPISTRLIKEVHKVLMETGPYGGQ
jgi:hypothetical protein